MLILQKFYKIKTEMILKIEFENFFSIRDRVRIDFRAASINTALARELSHNVMEWKGVPVLKTVGQKKKKARSNLTHHLSQAVCLGAI